MKVLLVSSKYPPEYAGSGLRAHRTHLRLNESYDVETEVICSSTEIRVPETYLQDSLSVTRVVSPFFRTVNSILGKGQIRRLTNAAVYRSEMNSVTELLKTKSPDVVHVFGYSPATLAAIRWSRQNGVPLMRELVNFVPSAFQYPPRQIGNPDYEFPDNSVVVAISQHLGEVSARDGLVDNVWVRPNPVDVERFAVPTAEARTEARQRLTNFASTDVVLVFVAKFRASKNHSFLIDVMDELPENFKLLLAGPPSDPVDSTPGHSLEDIERLKREIAARGLGDRIEIYPGFVDAADYMKAGDVFMMPTEREGMGTPLLEALVSGLPVVANATEPSLIEYVVDGQNGYLSHLDEAEWADAVIKASEISEGQRLIFAKEIGEKVSTARIDADYYRLLEALAGSSRGNNISVADVLKS